MKSSVRKSLLVRSLALVFALGLAACSSVPQKSPGEIAPERTVESFAPDDGTRTYAIDQYDPLEGFNRNVYRFNAWFDEAVFLPLAGAYDFILPDVVKQGVHNFMRNVGDVENLLNSVLQLKAVASLESAGRLLVNTTVGVLGVWDPATRMGFDRHDEDFGQTLGHYGMGPGPYLVLPVFGPSNLRDGVGLAVDAFAFSQIDPLFFDHNEDAWELSYYGFNALDTRHNTGFRYYETGSPFEYELVRLLYLKMRELEIAR